MEAWRPSALKQICIYISVHGMYAAWCLQYHNATHDILWMQKLQLCNTTTVNDNKLLSVCYTESSVQHMWVRESACIHRWHLK